MNLHYQFSGKINYLLILSVALIALTSCGKRTGATSEDRPETGDSTENNKVLPPDKRPLAIDNGKIFLKEGKKFLWGGEKEFQHFEITNCQLKDEQFHYGIGREKFPALLAPDFIDVSTADSLYAENARFLMVKMDGITKAYSVKDLTRHEVVNDEINGKPIMAAYCILADLGAIYDRTMGGKTFTFALSGYTYFDPEVWDGMDGFVLWDRETESLWWPLIGQSVSGEMAGASMKVLHEQWWSQTNWKDIKTNHPDALVLASGQDFERPEEWVRYNNVEPVSEEGQSIAPKWGENSTPD
ncbi:DUF3179 domain-containing (seleno)protein [Fulvivirgaceae bacterium BMA12]|uniref:DUF3179 domain-containing (Seleno)protein n=1 Tax=Agaribacillus aureus TaxID=3051825 RepID=A0ABT8LCW8_9BACT|nr:DUF3179 domain-containing (seleno)protein [Fulvivirgaceae bacterium BMA12]